VRARFALTVSAVGLDAGYFPCHHRQMTRLYENFRIRLVSA